MTYRGHVAAGGVIVLDGPRALPPGTIVKIEPITRVKPREKSAPFTQILRRWAGKGGKGLPLDLAENHDHYLYGRPKR